MTENGKGLYKKGKSRVNSSVLKGKAGKICAKEMNATLGWWMIVLVLIFLYSYFILAEVSVKMWIKVIKSQIKIINLG